MDDMDLFKAIVRLTRDVGHDDVPAQMKKLRELMAADAGEAKSSQIGGSASSTPNRKYIGGAAREAAKAEE